jgi:hypothetical protein
MGKAARERAAAEFTIEAMSGHIESLYRELIAVQKRN